MDNSRILDDLSRVAGGAFSILSALKTQVQSNMKDNMGGKFGSSFGSSAANDDVARLQGVVSKLRIEQESLKSRIAELEAMLGKKAPKAKAATAKPAAKAKPKAAPQKAAAPKAKTKKRAAK